MTMTTVLRDTWRLLTFRLTPQAYAALDLRHLYLGLLLCWLAGLGRFWAAAHVPWYGRLGLGSVIYPFVLAIPLTLLLRPFVERSDYLRYVTLLALTAPVALIYAPLVPEICGTENASILRMFAMGIVSLWRVALLSWFCFELLGLRPGQATATVILLLSGIVVALTALNLERAVFAIMGAADARTMSDDSFAILILLSVLSILALPISLICYAVSAFAAVKLKNREREIEEDSLRSTP